MSTRLTKAAASVKQLAIAGIAVVVVLIIANFLFRTIQQGISQNKPIPTPQINAPYGVLPRLAVSSNVPRTAGLRIELNTPQLDIPAVSYTENLVPVYAYANRTTNFDYISNLTKISSIFGITGSSPQRRGSETTYRYLNDQGATLDVDINYYHLTFELANRIAYVPIQQGATIPENTASETAKATLSALSAFLGIPPVERNLRSEVKFAFLNLNNQTEEVRSVSQANLTTVYLFRSNFSDIPFVNENNLQPNISFTYTQERAAVTGAASGRPKLLSASVTYWPIDQNSISTPSVYPIRPVAQAYQDIIAGNGYITTPINQAFTYQINSAYLAYFEPKARYDYVVPVWVFEGNSLENATQLFRVFIPAIATGYIEE